MPHLFYFGLVLAPYFEESIELCVGFDYCFCVAVCEALVVCNRGDELFVFSFFIYFLACNSHPLSQVLI